METPNNELFNLRRLQEEKLRLKNYMDRHGIGPNEPQTHLDKPGLYQTVTFAIYPRRFFLAY